jgi:hypothetical protein
MVRMPLQLRIEVGLEPDAEAAELDDVTLQLRRDLLQLDVDNIERATADPPPPGTRAVEAAVLGTLVVTVAREVVEAVVKAAANWLGRRRNPSESLTLEIAGDSIEITNPSAEDQRRLIEVFLAKHAPASS